MTTIQQVYGERPSFLDAINSLFKTRLNGLHVAELCKVSSIELALTTSYGIVKAEPLTVTDTSVDNAYIAYYFDPDLAVGDTVLIVITDIDFRQGLSGSGQPIRISPSDAHAKSNAVVVPLK